MELSLPQSNQKNLIWYVVIMSATFTKQNNVLITCGSIHVDHPSRYGLLNGAHDDGRPHDGDGQRAALLLQQLLCHRL